MMTQHRIRTLDYEKTKGFVKSKAKFYSHESFFEDALHDTYVHLLEREDKLSVHALTLFFRTFLSKAQLYTNAKGRKPPEISIEPFLDEWDEEQGDWGVQQQVNKVLSYEGHPSDTVSKLFHRARLTDKEAETACLLLAGFHGRDIADSLGVSPQAINLVKQKAFNKMKDAYVRLQ